MSLIQKITELRHWQNTHLVYKPNEFAGPADAAIIQKIEELLEEEFPAELKLLYTHYNGEREEEDTYGTFFGHRLVHTDEIISQLEYCKELVKPLHPKVNDPHRSGELIKEIVEFYLDKIPAGETPGTKKTWYKLKFECGPGSFGGPYLYANEKSTDREREILRIKDYSILEEVISRLHNLEKESYNWDKLEFTVYADGRQEVKRTFYNFDEELDLSSFPAGAIRKKYFHWKWVPFIKDSGGNYIGVDLDPDLKGTKGQVIVFGRDEEQMFVAGKNVEDFIDYLLSEVKNKPETPLKNSSHLHDTLKAMIVTG